MAVPEETMAGVKNGRGETQAGILGSEHGLFVSLVWLVE